MSNRKGTHGSLTKAGKVRQFTRDNCVVKPIEERSRQRGSPRIKNRRKYVRRVLYENKHKGMQSRRSRRR